MNFTDDEVVWISALLRNSKYNLHSEFSEVRSLKEKIHNSANQIVAKRARLVIKSGDWS